MAEHGRECNRGHVRWRLAGGKGVGGGGRGEGEEVRLLGREAAVGTRYPRNGVAGSREWSERQGALLWSQCERVSGGGGCVPEVRRSAWASCEARQGEVSGERVWDLGCVAAAHRGRGLPGGSAPGSREVQLTAEMSFECSGCTDPI